MGAVAVDGDSFDGPESLEETCLQLAGARDVLVPPFRNQARGFAHPRDLVRREGARAQAAFVSAAVDLRLQVGSRPATHVEGTHTLGP